MCKTFDFTSRDGEMQLQMGENELAIIRERLGERITPQSRCEERIQFLVLEEGKGREW